MRSGDTRTLVAPEEKPVKRVTSPDASTMSGLTLQIDEAFTVHPPTSSAWWFLGSLRPTAATRFNVQEVSVVGRDVRLEVFHDRIAVWSKPGTEAVQTHEQARELFGLVVGAYSLITGVALDWSLDGWVEARDATFGGTVMGVVADSRGLRSPMGSPRSQRSVDMRRAAKLAVATRHKPGWRLALRDIHAALDTPDDDLFVFAYRVLEDIARAVSGRAGELRASDWGKLHTHLGTSKAEFMKRTEPIRTARQAAAHGDELDPDLDAAREKPEHVLDLTRQIVAEALVLVPEMPFRLTYLRKA